MSYYGNLSISELIIYNNSNTNTSGIITYDTEYFIMNTGLKVNNIMFPNGTIQNSAGASTSGDNTFTGVNTFNDGVDITGNLTINGNIIINNDGSSKTLSYNTNNSDGNFYMNTGLD